MSRRTIAALFENLKRLIGRSKNNIKEMLKYMRTKIYQKNKSLGQDSKYCCSRKNSALIWKKKKYNRSDKNKKKDP